MTVLATPRRLNAGDGDYRDREEIRCRATQITDQLATDHNTDRHLQRTRVPGS